MPNVAGSIRIATYGTCSYILRTVRLSRPEIQMHSLSNILKVKLSIVAEDKGRQCNEKFSQRWVYIYKVLRLDIS